MDDILDRVSKLLAKARSTTNPHEAAIFADKAAEILAKHNLDEAMLLERDADREQGPIGQHPFTTRSPDRWRELILQGCAELYFCKLIRESHGAARHTFIGREHNAKVATLMAEYLFTTTKRLARQHSTSKGDQTDFRKGCGLTLYHRMVAMRRAHDGPSEGTDRSLPALYNNEERAVEEWMATRMKVRTSRKGKGIRLGASGAAGSEAGRGIGLNTQVAETRANRMLG